MGFRTAVYVNEEIKSMKDFINEEKERSSRTFGGNANASQVVRGAPHQLPLMGLSTRLCAGFKLIHLSFFVINLLATLNSTVARIITIKISLRI